jgi:NAD(P)H dehydrogenase (quinone)
VRVLVVYAHPCPESYVAALKDAALETLKAGGHELRLLDLYAMGFDPVLSAQERRAYHTAGENERLVSDQLAHLRWADGLLFIHPTWWYGPPAILKGWLDRVWIPHATFTLPADGKPIGRVLGQIAHLGVITTLGSPRWWWWYLGQPGRGMLLRGLKPLCGPRCRTLWLARHGIDSAGPRERADFLARVRREVARWAG